MFGLELGHAGAAGRHQKGHRPKQTADMLNPLLRRVFQQLPEDEEAEE